MSLVLDALRRQQAEQEPGAAVTLALAAEHRHRQRMWIAVLAVALMLNAAVLAWIFIGRDAGMSAGPDTTPQPATAPTQPAAPTASEVVPAAPEPTTAGATSPAADTAPTPTPPAAAPAPPSPEPPLRVIVERLPLDALPGSVRARFPGIAFSTHVYAADPSLRAIVANGERLQEGERVRGLLIREITETGVVFEFENYLVEVPVFTEW